MGAVERTINETIRGTEDANKIFGGTGRDNLIGLGGADLLNGGKGVATMRGGEGNDTYVVDCRGDTASETGGNGADSFDLPLDDFDFGSVDWPMV